MKPPMIARGEKATPISGRAGSGSFAISRSSTGSAGISVGCMSVRRGCDGGDRIDDLRVARAAAEIACDRLADRLLVQSTACVEVGACRHEHAGRADPALRRAVLEEGLLEAVERTALPCR